MLDVRAIFRPNYHYYTHNDMKKPKSLPRFLSLLLIVSLVLPANPAAPVIALRSLADVGNLTPGFVYAVAVNQALAGQILGSVVGVLTFTDEQGHTVHAVFA